MRIGPVLLLLLFPTYAGVLRAHSTNASIAGRVTDPGKAVIADAQVTAINAGTNVRYEGATNRSGEKSIKPDVILHVQDAVKIDFQESVAADDRVAPLECSQAVQDRIGTLSGAVFDVSGTGISGA